MRPKFNPSHHMPVTVRAGQQKVFVRHDVTARTITLTWAADPQRQTVLLDQEAFACACTVSLHRQVSLGDHTLPLTRDQARRLARVLRSMHHPAAEDITYQPDHGQGDPSDPAHFLAVCVTGPQGQGQRIILWPRSGRAVLMATRAAWRSSLHAPHREGDDGAFHRRITHLTGPDRQVDAAFLREARTNGQVFTLTQICADEHLLF